MAHGYEVMMNPPIEGLLDDVGSKFGLVILAAMRSREITSYLGQLSGGFGSAIPPQIASTSSKPLSIAFEEIAAQKIVAAVPDPQDENTQAAYLSPIGA